MFKSKKQIPEKTVGTGEKLDPTWSEAVSRNGSAHSSPEQLKKYLNNAEFGKFLETNNAELDETNFEEVEQRYRAFEGAKKATKDVTNFYKKELFDKRGVKFDKSIGEAVGTYLNELAVNDPEKLTQLVEHIEKFKSLPAELKAKEEELKEHTERAQKIQEKKRFLSKEIPASLYGNWKDKGWWSDRKQKNKDRKELNEKFKQRFGEELKDFGEFNDPNLLPDTITNRDEAQKKKEEVETTMNDIRNSLFNDVEVAQQIFQRAQEQAFKQLDELIDPSNRPNFRSVEKGFALFQKLKDQGGESFRFFEDAGVTEEEYEQNLQKILEEKITGDISEAILKSSTNSTPLDNMRKSLKRFTDRTDLGNKDATAAKEFIIEAIRAKSQDKDTGKLKKILLKTILMENSTL